MLCPHCGKDSETPPTGLTITFSPIRVKNLWINEWCSYCKKPKSCSYTTASADDPEAQDAPQMCQCMLYRPVPYGFTVTTGAEFTEVTSHV